MNAEYLQVPNAEWTNQSRSKQFYTHLYSYYDHVGTVHGVFYATRDGNKKRTIRKLAEMNRVAYWIDDEDPDVMWCAAITLPDDAS